MLTIIHGSDISASRNFFLEQRKKTQTPISLLAESVNLTDLSQILEGGELFATEKNLFVEQFLSRKKKSKERDAIISFLNEQAATHAIMLWEDKELERATLNAFKKAIIKDFKLPQSLFAFLDSVRPKNANQMITLFHKTLETTEAEMIFFMLVRQFRLLLALTEQSPSLRDHVVAKHSHNNTPSATESLKPKNDEDDVTPIDELKRLAPWQKTKMETQAKLFGIDKLLFLYSKLFQIELAQKTGQLPMQMIQTIDFFLLEV